LLCQSFTGLSLHNNHASTPYSTLCHFKQCICNELFLIPDVPPQRHCACAAIERQCISGGIHFQPGSFSTTGLKNQTKASKEMQTSSTENKATFHSGDSTTVKVAADKTQRSNLTQRCARERGKQVKNKLQDILQKRFLRTESFAEAVEI